MYDNHLLKSSYIYFIFQDVENLLFDEGLSCIIHSDFLRIDIFF